MRRLATLIALTIFAPAILVSTGASETRTTANPTLYFLYSMNCTMSVVNDSGAPVTSIAPGAYQVDIRTPVPFATLPQVGVSSTSMVGCNGMPQFQLTGPGVTLLSTMAAGCLADQVVLETFQPSSTYVATDLNQPSVTRVSFTTLASGTPARPVVTYGGGAATGQVSTDIVGSLSVQGTLDLKVSPTGTPTLTSNGKAVSKLPAGRYRFRVVDRDPKAGVAILGPKSKAPTVLAGARFTGTKSTTIALSAGRWTYFTSLRSVKYLSIS